MNTYTNPSTYETTRYTTGTSYSQETSLPIVYPALKAANQRADYKCRGTCSAYGKCSCGRSD
ncbi:MAG TPA: hypothetical protein VJB87_02810 [Candidatus Nanoarchaeia archaeon]|nr:hypothetical protein [Candidatus Nanoarchaeia archaeon]